MASTMSERVYAAATKGSPEELLSLLKGGANARAVDSLRRNAAMGIVLLGEMAGEGHLRCLDILIPLIDPRHEDKVGLNILDMALEPSCANRAVLERLAKSLPVEMWSKSSAGKPSALARVQLQGKLGKTSIEAELSKRSIGTGSGPQRSASQADGNSIAIAAFEKEAAGAASDGRLEIFAEMFDKRISAMEAKLSSRLSELDSRERLAEALTKVAELEGRLAASEKLAEVWREKSDQYERLLRASLSSRGVSPEEAELFASSPGAVPRAPRR